MDKVYADKEQWHVETTARSFKGVMKKCCLNFLRGSQILSKQLWWLNCLFKPVITDFFKFVFVCRPLPLGSECDVDLWKCENSCILQPNDTNESTESEPKQQSNGL